MRWKGRRQSTNVEDRRRMSSGGKKMLGGGLGTIAIVVVAMLLGADPSKILKAFSGGSRSSAKSNVTITAEEEELKKFVLTVLRDTEEVWDEQFKRMGRTYRKPTLVLYKGRTETPGGMADAAMGPFYMSADEKIYIDLDFYDQMKRDLKAPGDFAQAYVIAHEVGHHIQHLLGDLEKVHNAKRTQSEVKANQMSVRLELQADFYSGVWAYHAQKRWDILQRGDLEEALNAASKIGDDNLQKRAGRRVSPDSFTHGSSAQRVAWFRYGFETGEVRKGNTFDDRIWNRVDPAAEGVASSAGSV